MSLQRWNVSLFRFVCALSWLLLSACGAIADLKIQSDATGTGVYIPSIGYYYGPGEETTLGPLSFSGMVETEQTGPLTSSFQNPGRGTKNEVLHQTIAEDGSSLSFRFRGTVELIPLDADGNFTAVWEGKWEIVDGTGIMRGAKGTLDVIAVNQPFTLADAYWEFDWAWSGEIKLKKDALNGYAVLQTGGFGVFAPANLGFGDPSLGFPVIIGDGSGLAVYDGTPTGFEFTLDGELVGDGFDQHFGSALSLTPGIPVGARFQYPGIEEENPAGPGGRNIHIMATRIGELWLQKTYYFELDPEAFTIIARVHFRVVGGTGAFEKASGSIYCRVLIDLLDVFIDDDNQVNAPFRYDFNGYLSKVR